jgi:hypothetical protein
MATRCKCVCSDQNYGLASAKIPIPAYTDLIQLDPLCPQSLIWHNFGKLPRGIQWQYNSVEI